MDYEQIKKRYGKLSSWAVWPDCNDCSLEEYINQKQISNELKPQYVFVGLNPSSFIENTKDNWVSFHVSSNDNRLRYAIENTLFEGAYLTDVIKYKEEDNDSLQEEGCVFLINLNLML